MGTTQMSAETAAGVAAYGLAGKLGAIFGAGVLGAAVMAAFDPPKNRKQLFLHAAVAGIGSWVFGGLVHLAAIKYVTFATPNDLFFPAYFLTGAVSWGALGFLATLRRLVHERAAEAVAKRIGIDHQQGQNP